MGTRRPATSSMRARKCSKNDRTDRRWKSSKSFVVGKDRRLLLYDFASAMPCRSLR